MRVTCPNCSAVYEAPDAALGVGGRRVECSACGHQWFQPGPELEAMERGGSSLPGLSEAAQELSALSQTTPAPVSEVDLEPAPEPEREPAPEPSRLRTAEPPRPPRPGAPRPGETREPAARRPATIDAERLSAELRAAEAEEESRSGGGMAYAAGFVLALILCGLLTFAYLEQEQVAAMVPEARPYLETWSDVVDQARLRIEAIAQLVAQKASELLG